MSENQSKFLTMQYSQTCITT